ncbi:F0F1 ATP synthase subunit epsilon [Schleiferia thermophila]|jgi:F-type H+-transporting ATPase subunit epsilon|uniref:F-type H+-transporting ATPase subunit epsilon n=1 Tax=Schleiferia thermophila TaxID=884107 RepID=A0A369A5R0_9FLAO|nr:hypothetical protein [Schleiferia thermophila]KFD38936.1 ATP synthase subunit delta [Schleiferia thermophila str. Yellowstone]PMB16079.1 hypothetical protein CEN47_27125 [Fischerella thermalis CCMEE 5319]RCX03748.1 F-type H+-transporting ATPase subunit epsilon [Schleiferia thermophila]GCD79982.1 ATP synthase epsilon chain [Schleiferia thermophila]
MNVEIVSPEGKVFSGQAKAVQLPGTNGLFQILDNHAPLISTLTSGSIKLEISEKTADLPSVFEKTSGSQYLLPIKGGVVEVLANKVIILVD